MRWQGIYFLESVADALIPEVRPLDNIGSFVAGRGRPEPTAPLPGVGIFDEAFCPLVEIFVDSLVAPIKVFRTIESRDVFVVAGRLLLAAVAAPLGC